jgi:hypothetical protein
MKKGIGRRAGRLNKICKQEAGSKSVWKLYQSENITLASYQEGKNSNKLLSFLF